MYTYIYWGRDAGQWVGPGTRELGRDRPVGWDPGQWGGTRGSTVINDPLLNPLLYTIYLACRKYIMSYFMYRTF